MAGENLSEAAASHPEQLTGGFSHAYGVSMRFVFDFAWQSPLIYGYALIGVAAFVKVYSWRRKYYLDRNLAADFDVSYHGMIAGKSIDILLWWTSALILILGILVLLRNYEPELFGGLSGIFRPSVNSIT